jgi:hypothetical protein
MKFPLSDEEGTINVEQWGFEVDCGSLAVSRQVCPFLLALASQSEFVLAGSGASFLLLLLMLTLALTLVLMQRPPAPSSTVSMAKRGRFPSAEAVPNNVFRFP